MTPREKAVIRAVAEALSEVAATDKMDAFASSLLVGPFYHQQTVPERACRILTSLADGDLE